MVTNFGSASAKLVAPVGGKLSYMRLTTALVRARGGPCAYFEISKLLRSVEIRNVISERAVLGVVDDVRGAVGFVEARLEDAD